MAASGGTKCVLTACSVHVFAHLPKSRARTLPSCDPVTACVWHGPVAFANGNNVTPGVTGKRSAVVAIYRSSGRGASAAAYRSGDSVVDERQSLDRTWPARRPGL